MVQLHSSMHTCVVSSFDTVCPLLPKL